MWIILSLWSAAVCLLSLSHFCVFHDEVATQWSRRTQQKDVLAQLHAVDLACVLSNYRWLVTLSFCMIHRKCLSISYQQTHTHSEQRDPHHADSYNHSPEHLDRMALGSLGPIQGSRQDTLASLHLQYAQTWCRLPYGLASISICHCVQFIPSWTRSSSSESDQPALDGFNVAPNCFNRLFACLLFAAIVSLKRTRNEWSVGKRKEKEIFIHLLLVIRNSGKSQGNAHEGLKGRSWKKAFVMLLDHWCPGNSFILRFGKPYYQHCAYRKRHLEWAFSAQSSIPSARYSTSASDKIDASWNSTNCTWFFGMYIKPFVVHLS